jgi:thymidine kinase
MKKGKLTVIAGPMFSGKTGKLVAMMEVFTQMGHKVLVVKPSVDTRYGGLPEIHSHDHKKAKAMTIEGKTVPEILEKILKTRTDKVIFDEVQFFDKDIIIKVITTLKKKGIHVIASGLLYDYKRTPFGATPELMGLADERLELMAICQKCGSLARHSARVKGGKSVVVVGASDKYIATCEKCHTIYK